MPLENPSQKKGRKMSKRATKAVMKSYRLKLPKLDLPLRFRPWFILFTSIFVVLLALLNVAGLTQSLPFNSKFMRILCMCLATTMFYFIFDADEESRRVWFWRHAGLIITTFVCFFCGGIISEIVQALLPHGTFDISDVAANLLGSAVGLWIAYFLERYYRHRREISRLYRPISLDPTSTPASESDYESDEGTMLLPTHYEPRRPRTATATVSKSHSTPGGKETRHIRLGPGDVWDEREDDFEVFGIGSDEESDSGRGRRNASARVSRSEERASSPVGPKIVVSEVM